MEPTTKPRDDADHGLTLVEIVIAITLIGLVVVGTMTLLTGTINATGLNRDHANAHAWLQTAADMLYAREIERCDPTSSVPVATQVEAIRTKYETTVRETKNPMGWTNSNIRVTSVQFWHIAMNDTTKVLEEAWVSNQCVANKTTDLQKIGLEVTAEDGRIVETVEVIIGGE